MAYSLEAVTVWVAHKRSIVGGMIVLTQAGRTAAGTTEPERGFVKSLNSGA